MATEDGAVHSSLVDCLPPTTGFVSACEVRMDKGVKVKRYLVIGRKSVVLADIVKDGDRMKAIVKKNVKFATVDCVILQKEDVRKAMFKKAEETVVLIKRKTPPDVLLNLTQDPKNTVLATSEYLVEVLGTHFASATGEEIRIEWRGKGEKPKVEADADLTRPDDASHDGDEPEENGAFSDNEQDGEQYQDERQGHDTLGRPPLGGGGGRSHSPEPRYADDNESDAHAPRKKVSISRDPQQVVYAEGARALPPRGLRARGFSTASPPPSGTPLNIWFVCAEKEEAAGQYSYNASVAHNGMPVFDQATGQRLYVSKTNRWVVGTIESMEQDGCWVASVEEHKGRMPHEMTTGWAMQEDGTWKLQPNTTATDQQHLGEGLALQSSVIRQHHSITLLSDRFSDLMAERHSGVRMRPIACDDLCSTIRKLEAQAKADIARNVVLLHPRRPGELFTELEISDIRQLLQRLALGVSEMDEKVYALEELLAVDGQSDAHTSMLNINPNSPASPLTQRRSSVDSRAGKPATSFAPLASSYSDRERRHEDDQLLWSFTLQSAQLVSFDDAVLRMTCKADVYTSNRQTLTPCAIAITDMGLYLCTLVEGKIIHQQSLDDVDSLIYFTDRRFIGLRLPTVYVFSPRSSPRVCTYRHRRV
ncbi:hypothetical protein DIPPA_23935 [Diplonema papillatum]|nr:hypothetical protein DIPPA_23935 [Diplonema papillatum]